MLLGVIAVAAVSIVALFVLGTTEASSLLNGVSAGPSCGQAWAVGNFQPSGGATQTLIEFNP